MTAVEGVGAASPQCLDERRRVVAAFHAHRAVIPIKVA